MTDNKRKAIINKIWECLEEGLSYSGKELNGKEVGFMEDMIKRLEKGIDMTTNQFDWLTDLIGMEWQ